MKDLFNLSLPERKPIKKRKQNGYAALPGGGKKGETCKTCEHYANFGTYRKCELMRRVWNSSFGTDILARSPAWVVSSFSVLNMKMCDTTRWCCYWMLWAWLICNEIQTFMFLGK